MTQSTAQSNVHGNDQSQMKPVRPNRRIEVVDVLRGFAVLGILLFNMLSFSGYLYTPLEQMGAVHRAAVVLIKFVAQAKFYTLFSFLFGWGMAIQMARAARRGARFVPHFVRRLLVLLLIGLTHAILIWDGDILVSYAVLGMLLLIFRHWPEKALLVVAAFCILIPVLVGTPGPAAEFRAAYAEVTEPFRQAMMAGHYENVLEEGSYLEAVVHRFHASVYGYTNVVYWGPHILGMFLLGLYVGRRKLLHNPAQHLPLFRWLMWGGFAVGLAFNLIFITVTVSPGRIPPAYHDLAGRGARTIAGSALSLAYLSAVVLLYQRRAWRQRLASLAPVGRMALTNYMTHSILFTLLFYGYGLELYGRLGPAITLVLTLVTYQAQVSLSNWWLSRYRFGPVEALWRGLTYGEFPRLRLTSEERAARRAERRKTRKSGESPEALPELLSEGLLFAARRLLFIAAVGFAIVYFCILGMRLTSNSTASLGRGRSALGLAIPALEETFGFFGDLFGGNLGYVVEGVTQRTTVPVSEMVLDTFVSSGSLLLVAIGFAAVIGICAGGLAALRSHSVVALSTLTLTVVGVSIPSFFLALLFQIADIKFYQRTGMGLFPVYGMSTHRTESLLPQVIAPALVLAARPLAHTTWVTFVNISEILHRDYIRTARSKGLTPRVVFWRHTLRNAGVSILTAIVVSLRFALGSLPVVEIFFTWPGIGVTMLNAIFDRDVKVVAILALALGVTFLLVNFLADLLYRVIDPRLRTADDRGGQ